MPAFSFGTLPIGTRLKLQSTDSEGWAHLCHQGYNPESSEAGFYIMRRDLPPYPHEPAPPLPRFPVEIVGR